MILDIFIPEKIGSYYLLPKRILGFEITKTHVYASQVFYSGNSIIIERFYQEAIDQTITRSYNERAAEAIRAIVDQVSNYDLIRVSIASTLVIFKELTLPFLETEKIAMILPFEIEQYLPFSTQNVILDFIITKKYIPEHKSDIMVAAVQKEFVAEQLSFFDLVGYQAHALTVDLFDLYSLYCKIPSYKNKNTDILIDIELNTTRIMCIVHGQLKLIRALPKGIAHIVKAMAQDLTITSNKALEDLIRFGFEKNSDIKYKTVADSAFKEYLQDIQFTLKAFATQMGRDLKINHLLLLGMGSEIPNIEKLFTQIFTIPCSIFDINSLLKMPEIIIKTNSRIPRTNIMSLATALPSEITEQCNFRKQEFALPTSTLFYKQFFAMFSLLILIFGLLIGHSYWQTRTLKSTIQTMEKSVITKLNELDLTDEKQFSKAIEDAQEKVEKEEELWFGFSRQARFSFLKALQDLSLAIDRKAVGLDLKKLIITTNEITLEGEVKGFEELKILERELRESKLFTYVPTLQELKFSEKLPLQKNSEGHQ